VSKRIWMIVALLGVVLLGALLVVSNLLDVGTYRGPIQTALSDSLGRPVQLEHLEFSLFSGSLVAAAPSIGDDPAFNSQPFLTAKDIRIGIETGALLFHHDLHITGLSIEQPAITLLRKEDGTWNYSSIGSEGKRKAPTADTGNLLPNLTVGKLRIEDGTLTVGTLPAKEPPHVYSELNVSAQNFSFEHPFPFKMSGKLPNGGSLDINGNAGPINQRDASLTPVTAQISLKHADLVAGGLVAAGQGISGIADLDTKIVANGRTAQVDGKLHMSQIQLAKNGSPSSQPVDVQFSVNEDLQALSGKIANASVQVGKAALNVIGSYERRGNTASTQLHVSGQNMPIDDLVAFLPSLGVQLPAGSRLHGGTLTISVDVIGPVTAPSISGPVRVANTQLAGFDLGQKLSSIQSLSGTRTGSNTTIQVLSTNLHYGPEGTRTDNLAAVVSGLGSASGSGWVSAGGALNYHLTVKLDSGAGAVASQGLSMIPGALGSAIGTTAKNGIPLIIGGTTANPIFTPDMGKMLGGVINKKSPAVNPLGKALGGIFHH
jgi:AsmA protein